MEKYEKDGYIAVVYTPLRKHETRYYYLECPGGQSIITAGVPVLPIKNGDAYTVPVWRVGDDYRVHSEDVLGTALLIGHEGWVEVRSITLTGHESSPYMWLDGEPDA